MKAVIQRGSEACVNVDGQTIGEIRQGFLVLLGVMQEDTEKEMQLLAKKVSEIRIFTDENDKMNLSLSQVSNSY